MLNLWEKTNNLYIQIVELEIQLARYKQSRISI